ncbi:YggN family protein [Serratia sp. D1N4]
MLNKTGLALLLLVASQAHAEYQCNVRPQDDVIISPQSVQVTGASGNLQISADGDVTRNGQVLNLNDTQRQKAFSYQSALRKDLPWIDQGAQQHLEKARASLDNIIVQQLGSSSNVRNRLTTLNTQLKQQMNRIIEHRSDGLAFHHKAIAQVEQDGRNLVQQSMGGVLQDSLNEMGIKQAANANGNPLQALMGNLGGLQQAIQSEWSKQEQSFQNFGNDVCNRVTALETQRKNLINALK